ncbi:transposase [Patescibacteria group bacterium]|nr:transposase [Patescibacteria group bacterium]
MAQQSIFSLENEGWRFLQLLDFYRFVENPLRFSYYLKLSNKRKDEYLSRLYFSKARVEIYGFCLMPNHYHLEIKQKEDGGISDFIRIVENSYARYFNLKQKRQGAVFQSPFKAERIESKEDAIHVLRYIHLNPLTSFVIKKPEELENYLWTSFMDYMSVNPRHLINTNFFLDMFGDKQEFAKFCLNQVEYQRELGRIKEF